MPASPSSLATAAGAGASSRTSIPNVILHVSPRDVRTVSLTRRADKTQFLLQRSTAESGPSFVTGPWLASWSASPATRVTWPASATAVESALSTLSMVSGVLAAETTAQPLGNISVSGTSLSARSVTIFPPDVGGALPANIDGQNVHLSSDPSSILEEATWSVLTRPLLAPGFGRDTHIISVQEADRELLIERRFRSWIVRSGKLNGPYTTYVGDTASCEALAKVLSELAFHSISFTAAESVPSSGPTAQISLYRRATGTLVSESGGDVPPADRATFHTAKITLRGTLGVLGAALEGTSRLTLKNPDDTTREFGPVNGQLDPSILKQVSINHWKFVSLQAMDTPAADILRFTIGQDEYARKFTTWQITSPVRSSVSSTDHTSQVPLDTRVRNFLFSLQYARADSVSAAPSERPPDAVTLQLHSALRKEPTQLQMWVRAGQVTIIEGDRCLVYTTPSDVLALSNLLPR